MKTVRPRPFTDPLVETFDFTAETNGSEYEVRVGLPASYHHGGGPYPLLLALDADVAFGITHATSAIEAMWSLAPLGYQTPRLPEVVVVGIALPDRHTNPFRRNFEYMPEADPAEFPPVTVAYLERLKAMLGQEPRFGGAPIFQGVLEHEVIPLIERTYRVDPGRRMIFGQSAGGTFACYTLFTRPDLFTDYVIVSPGMMDQSIFRLEAARGAQGGDLRARVLLSAGEREVRDPFGILGGTVRLAEQLHARRYRGLELTFWIVPDASHVQAGAPSLARAMAFLGRSATETS